MLDYQPLCAERLLKNGATRKISLHELGREDYPRRWGENLLVFSSHNIFPSRAIFLLPNFTGTASVFAEYTWGAFHLYKLFGWKFPENFRVKWKGFFHPGEEPR